MFIYLTFLCGCTNLGNNQVSTTFDPYENTNRSIFAFNQKFDQYVLNPISKKYKEHIPQKVRNGISNHLNWISIPSTMINSTIQLEGENLALSSINFLLNSLTLGIYDLDENETKFHNLDYGSSLAKYNYAEGPYLVIPFLGPNTFRDFSGTIIDRVSSNQTYPKKFTKLKTYQIPIDSVNKRTNFSNVITDINTSSDPYIKMRSFYLQRRRKEILIDNDYEIKNNLEEDKEFEKLLQ